MSPYPTHKGVAFVITYPKGREYQRRKVGAMLIPNGFYCEDAERAIRRRFPMANAFRLYGQEGNCFFCGSL